MNKCVSIIIPVYNVEKYIEQCINSIIRQNYNNIEIIIINDGSTDNSKNIIEKYKNIDERIIYIEQSNKGVSVARNEALKISTGDYILFVDPDDYLSDKTIEKFVKEMNESNADIIIGSYTKVFDDEIKGNDCICTFNMDENRIYSGNEVCKMMLEAKVEGILCNKMFRRELLVKYNFTFEENRCIEDWYPVFNHISNINKVKFINDSIYNYRQRSGSSVNKVNEKKLIDYEYAASLILNQAKSSNEFDIDTIKSFNANVLNGIIRYYVELNSQKRINLYKSFDESKYSKYDLSLIKIIKLKNVKNKIKLNLILWKLRLYHIALKLFR